MIEDNYTQQQPYSQTQEPDSNNQTNSTISPEIVINSNQENKAINKNKFFKLLVPFIFIIVLTVLILAAFLAWSKNSQKKTTTPKASISSTQEMIVPEEELLFARSEVSNIVIVAQSYKLSDKANEKYPSNLDQLKNGGFVEAPSMPEGVAYTYTSTKDGNDCEIKFTFSTGKQITNTCLNSLNPDILDGVFEKTPQELEADKKIDEKLPYVSANIDVEMVFSAVSQYRAVNVSNPTSIQNLIDSGYLSKNFQIKERKGYSIEYSGVKDEDTKVIVKFESGDTITAKYDDPNWAKKFVENYPSTK